MANLQLKWLGPPEIELDGRPLRLEMRKTLALLAYLSLCPQSPTRESLATLFWSEYDQQHALSNLRRNLSSLIQRLPPGILEAGRERIGLKKEAWLKVDVDEFLAHLACEEKHAHLEEELCTDCLKHLEGAVSCYRGDFFEGINLKDCPEFDEWQFFQREELRAKYARVLEKLAAYYAAQRHWQTAIARARAWLTLDRLHEPAYRMLMRLYFLSGQRSIALRQYKECQQTLDQELGQSPEPETQELYKEICSNTPPEPEGRRHLLPSAAALPVLDIPIIKTKFFLPKIPHNMVRRPRLVSRLSKVSQTPLTIISAPAGFGKTTLLADWLSNAQMLVAWVGLDKGDNNPHSLLTYIISAIRAILPDSTIGLEALEQLRLNSPAPVETILSSLINDLIQLSEQIVLVLDDYHNVQTQEAHKVINFLLEHQPQTLHLIISTRFDPPLSLARMRSNVQLIEIRSDELRFTTEEARVFLNEILDLDISEGDIDILYDRTEGWIAGFKMVSIAMNPLSQSSRVQEKNELIRTLSGSHRYILDYLTEEVLNSQPEFIRIFLMKTSILDRFCAPLCEAVLGSLKDKNGSSNSKIDFCFEDREVQNYQQILEYLDRMNIFIIPLDEERGWYRYHHLFADLLRARSLSTNRDQLTALYSRAAAWSASMGLWREAIQYALQAKDYKLGADLFEQAILTEHINFLSGSMQPLIEPFPADWVQPRPLLCLAKAIGMDQTSQYSGIENLLETAELGILNMPSFEGKDELLGRVYITQSISASIAGDSKRIIDACQKVIQCLPNNTWANIEALVELGDVYYYEGNLHKVDLYWRQALDLSQSINYDYGTFLSKANLIRLCWHIGELDRGEVYFQSGMQQLANGINRFPGWLVATQREYSEILREKNCLQEAFSLMSSCLSLSERGESASGQALGYIHMGKILLAWGDIAGARSMLKNAEDYCSKHSVYPDVGTLLQVFYSQLCLAENRLEQAWQIIDSCLHSSCCKHEFHREWAMIAQARILLRMDNPDEVIKLLSGRVEDAREKGRMRNWLEMVLLTALARNALGDQQQALRSLETGLIYMVSQGFMRIFLDEGAAMQDLLSSGKRREIWPDANISSYVDKLLAGFSNSETS